MDQCKVYNFNSYREKRKMNEELLQQDRDLSLFINSVIPFMDEPDQEELSKHDEQSEEFYFKISEIMMKAAKQRYKES